MSLDEADSSSNGQNVTPRSETRHRNMLARSAENAAAAEPTAASSPASPSSIVANLFPEPMPVELAEEPATPSKSIGVSSPAQGKESSLSPPAPRNVTLLLRAPSLGLNSSLRICSHNVGGTTGGAGAKVPHMTPEKRSAVARDGLVFTFKKAEDGAVSRGGERPDDSAAPSAKAKVVKASLLSGRVLKAYSQCDVVCLQEIGAKGFTKDLLERCVKGAAAAYSDGVTQTTLQTPDLLGSMFCCCEKIDLVTLVRKNELEVEATEFALWKLVQGKVRDGSMVADELFDRYIKPWVVMPWVGDECPIVVAFRTKALCVLCRGVYIVNIHNFVNTVKLADGLVCPQRPGGGPMKADDLLYAMVSVLEIISKTQAGFAAVLVGDMNRKLPMFGKAPQVDQPRSVSSGVSSPFNSRRILGVLSGMPLRIRSHAAVQRINGSDDPNAIDWAVGFGPVRVTYDFDLGTQAESLSKIAFKAAPRGQLGTFVAEDQESFVHYHYSDHDAVVFLVEKLTD